MVKLSQSYQLGWANINLEIVSVQDQSTEQLQKRLVPLQPFQCNGGQGETWFLNMSDSTALIFRKTQAFINDEHQNYFFAESDDPRVLDSARILFSVMLLATRMHVRRHGLCLHAAAVSRNGKGFLFLGEGGAGKSTASRFSAEIGIQVLAEDRIFLIHQEPLFLLAPGPHPATEYIDYPNLRTSLHGIFVLVKDDKDFLVPLSQPDAVKYLFAAFLQNSASGFIPSDEMILAFKTISEVGRQIPTYALHLRKSPDFWKIINERFPD
jgi:hypothetical protein